MKRISKIIIFFSLVFGIFFSGCDDMLDIDSNRVAFYNPLNSPNDSVHSVVGILKQMRKLGDRYIILGELRADLLEVTKINTDKDLENIYKLNFKADDENPYLTTKEYYDVINLCNYFIVRADTANVKVLAQEFAVVKAIRAWTYMQLALNYGNVEYIEEPILEVKDQQKDYPIYNMERLARELIEDLKPYEAIIGDLYPKYPDYASSPDLNILGQRIHYSFLPISFILGDLHLWIRDYKGAAYYYHNLISGKFNRAQPVDSRVPYLTAIYGNRWSNNPDINPSISSGVGVTSKTGVYVSSGSSWGNIFTVLQNEVFSVIGDQSATAATDMKIQLMTSTPMNGSYGEYTYKVRPSTRAVNNWDEVDYIYTPTSGANPKDTIVKGDLRGLPNKYDITTGVNDFNIFSYYKSYSTLISDTVYLITKYKKNNYAFLYRNTTLLLRYAEALNRDGKPSLALAVLKYGLTEETISDPLKVDQNEVPSIRPSYLDFSYMNSAQSVMMVGVHARGAGNVPRNEKYGFAEDWTFERKVNYVDSLIINELALETAFEGNRFHDLMRFELLTNKRGLVAEYVDASKNDPAVKNKLLQRDWFLPYKFDVPLLELPTVDPEEELNNE